MIGIGNDFGGPEHRGSEVAKVLNRAMNIAAKERDPSYDDGTHVWINPIFIVRGSVSRPDFEGIKRGHFSRKSKGLVLMIAVPADVKKEQGAREFVVAALRESVRSAAEHFASKGMSFSTLGAEKIIRAIERNSRQTNVRFPPIAAITAFGWGGWRSPLLSASGIFLEVALTVKESCPRSTRYGPRD